MGQINKQVNMAFFTEFEKVECEDRVLAMVEPVEPDEDEPSEEVVGYGRGVDLSASPSKEGWLPCYDVRFVRVADGSWRPTGTAQMVWGDPETGRPVGRMFWDPQQPGYQIRQDVVSVDDAGRVVFAD